MEELGGKLRREARRENERWLSPGQKSSEFVLVDVDDSDGEGDGEGAGEGDGEGYSSVIGPRQRYRMQRSGVTLVQEGKGWRNGR